MSPRLPRLDVSKVSCKRQRPPGAENRSRVGHLEGDTVIGAFDRHCILTLVDRKTGDVMIGKLFRGFKALEKATGAAVFFATPHHSWERGTSENTNGLIRQTKDDAGTLMTSTASLQCSTISRALYSAKCFIRSVAHLILAGRS